MHLAAPGFGRRRWRWARVSRSCDASPIVIKSSSIGGHFRTFPRPDEPDHPALFLMRRFAFRRSESAAGRIRAQ